MFRASLIGLGVVAGWLVLTAEVPAQRQASLEMALRDQPHPAGYNEMDLTEAQRATMNQAGSPETTRARPRTSQAERGTGGRRAGGRRGGRGGSGGPGRGQPVVTAGFIPELSDGTGVNVVLGRPTDHSVTASVLSATRASAFVEWGERSREYTSRSEVFEIRSDEPTEVVLDSLRPDTRHFYRVVRTQGTGSPEAEHSFHTQRARGSTFTFTVQADSHLGTDHHCTPALYAQTLLNEAADQPDFVIDLGDTFRSDVLRDINEANVNQLYINQRPFFGLVCNSAPLFLVIGNHEGESGWLMNRTPDCMPVWSARARQTWYANPAPDSFYTGSASAVPFVGLRENCYAFTWGDALFVMLDPYSYTARNPRGSRDAWDWTLGEGQHRWLERTLRESDARFKFVFAHHILGTCRGGIEWASLFEWGGSNRRGDWEFDTQRPGWDEPIHQLMAETGVTIFFQGHDHLFARQELDGVVYQTCPMPSDASFDEPNAEAYLTGDKHPNSGHVRVVVAPGGVTVDYVRAFLPGQENSQQHSGDVAFSYRAP